MNRNLYAIGICLGLLFVSSAAAFDLTPGRTIAVGRTSSLSDGRAAELVSNPSAGIRPREVTCELGGIRRFELPDLDEAYVAVAGRFSRWTFSLGLAQFGHGDFYAERTLRLGAATAVSKHLTLGGTFSGRRLEFGAGYESLAAMSFGVCVLFRADRLRLAVTADNLTRPRMHESATPLEPLYRIQGEVAGDGSYAVYGAVDLQRYEKPRFGLGQKITVSSRANILWGATSEPLTIGGGFDIMYREFRVCYAASYHPTLGLTQTLSLGIELFGNGEKSEPADTR